jgi:hypothetical protein
VTNTTLIPVTGGTGNEPSPSVYRAEGVPGGHKLLDSLLGGAASLTIKGSSGADTGEFGANGVDLDNYDAADVTDPTRPGSRPSRPG